MCEFLKQKLFKPTLKNLSVLALFWLMIGFSVGTGVLLGPVRKMTFYLRSNGWNPAVEDIVVSVIIGLYIIVTFFAALYFTRIWVRSTLKHVSTGLMLMWFVLSASSLYLWLTPSVMTAAQEMQVSNNPRFTFGPYPTADKIEELEQEGYTAIISLLHPAVVPFEPQLIRQERETVQGSGMQFIHLPMLPWISNNVAALDSLQAIVESGSGKYYVHCYLGQDRIGSARRIVESAGTPVEINQPDSLAQDRMLTNDKELERGPVTILEEGVYITPYPTDSEFIRYIFGHPYTRIISLLNPEDPEDLEIIEEEKEILSNYQMPFSNFPISFQHYDPDSVLNIARQVKRLDPPVVVHGYLTPSRTTEAFIQAFRSGRPPLAPGMYSDIDTVHAITLAAPNVAIYDHHSARDKVTDLYENGIRKSFYVGTAPDSVLISERRAFSRAGITWYIDKDHMADAGGLLDSLKTDGPWFVYGSDVAQIKKKIISSMQRIQADSVDTSISDIDPAESDIVLPAFIQSFLEEWIPSPKKIVLLSPPLIIYLFLSAFFAGFLNRDRGMATAYTRKVFHVCIFMMAGILQLLAGLSAVVLFGTLTALAVLYAVWRGEEFPFYESMARPSDRPRRSLFIIIPLATTALGGIVSNLLFGSVAYIGYLVTGLGDAAGEPVGKRWGRLSYQVPSLAGVPAKRTIEGSAAVLFVSITVAFLALWVEGNPFGTAFRAALYCGFAATLVEAVSNHGLDNFTIQIASTAVVYFLLS